MDDFKNSLARFDLICKEAWKTRHETDSMTGLAEAAREEVMRCIDTPAMAAEAYRQTCENYLASTLAAKGMPVRAVSNDESGGHELKGLYGNGIDFAVAERDLKSQLARCVDRYRRRADSYFQAEQAAVVVLIDDYFRAVPETTSARDRQISHVKAVARTLRRWSRLFYIWHARAFPCEVKNYLIALGRTPARRPIAVKWHYSMLDEDPEIVDVEPHRSRDDRYFLVDESWAVQQGFVSLSDKNKLSAIDLPGREIGCMCSVMWLDNLAELPDDLLTDVGRRRLQRR